MSFCPRKVGRARLLPSRGGGIHPHRSARREPRPPGVLQPDRRAIRATRATETHENRVSPVIRILHVFGRLVRGGAQMRTLDLLRHVDRSRFQLHFLTLSDVRNELDEEIRSLGGHVHQIPFGLLHFPARFRQLVRRNGFHVVHSHIRLPSGWIVRLASRLDVATRIVHFRSSGEGACPSLARTAREAVLRRWIRRHATDILAVSQGAMESVWGPRWPDDPRCRVVYNGLDPQRFRGDRNTNAVRREFGFPGDCPLLIHVGRIVREKNHSRLIEVFHALRRHRPDARLLMVGWDPAGRGQSIERRIRELGLAEEVVLRGERRDVPRLLKAADLLVLPSLWEGLPGVVLEAAAAGTPVLASDLPGVREIAARLPRVRGLSLELPNPRWADVAGELLERRHDDRPRREAQRCFADSVFTIDRYAGAMTEIWSGASSRRAA